MIRVRQIKIPVLKDTKETILFMIAKKLRVPSSTIQNFSITKKAIDARDKENVLFVYEVDVDTSLEKEVLKKNHSIDIFPTPKEEYSFTPSGTENLSSRIVVVGSGPAGLFCTYMLAKEGYHPILLERGEKMEERVQSVQHFFDTNELNPNSNIQFGEGGAGTFSDGKLNTLVKDKAFRGKKVFEIFVENGAPQDILYLHKPHIGTDLLRNVIISIREKILSMGGEIHYQSMVTDIFLHEDHIVGVEVNHQERIDCQVLVMAIGHSARETFYMLHDRGVWMRPKNFAVGLRIEHPQDMINKSQYGKFASFLPAASYKLTHSSSNGRGVYSFCMCPGGFAVNASSEKGLLAVNGMSNHDRSGQNANSAIVVTVSSKDYGEQLFDGLEYQRRLERKAYDIGKGFIPVQLYQDFLNHQISQQFFDVVPNTKGRYSFADFNELFSAEICQSLKEAISSFGTKIQGFDRGDAILLGVESRTSSPIMIERNEEGVSNITGLYPCGEGAGYAGGITTAAMDGIQIAECIMKKYHAFHD